MLSRIYDIYLDDQQIMCVVFLKKSKSYQRFVYAMRFVAHMLIDVNIIVIFRVCY